MDGTEDISTVQEAAHLLEEILGYVDSEVLDASGAAGQALVRHLEGALIALRALHERGDGRWQI